VNWASTASELRSYDQTLLFREFTFRIAFLESAAQTNFMPPLLMTNDNQSVQASASQSKDYTHPRAKHSERLSRFTGETPIHLSRSSSRPPDHIESPNCGVNSWLATPAADNNFPLVTIFRSVTNVRSGGTVSNFGSTSHFTSDVNRFTGHRRKHWPYWEPAALSRLKACVRLRNARPSRTLPRCLLAFYHF
jgi:hypothetical protein